MVLINCTSFGQLTKQELPTETLIDKSSNSSSNIEISGNKMIYQSDSTLHYGFQHTVTYDMEWTSDSTFNLSVVKHVIINNNPGLGKKRTRKSKKHSKSQYDFFDIARFQNWYWEDLGNGDYKLQSLEQDYVRFIFIKMQDK